MTTSNFVLAFLNMKAENYKLAKDTLLHEVFLIFHTFSIVLDAVTSVKTWAHEAQTLYMQQA
jgi:hypothetical protein